jgi:hypothetical protein
MLLLLIPSSLSRMGTQKIQEAVRIAHAVLGDAVKTACELAERNILGPVLRGKPIDLLALEVDQKVTSFVTSLSIADLHSMQVDSASGEDVDVSSDGSGGDLDPFDPDGYEVDGQDDEEE